MSFNSIIKRIGFCCKWSEIHPKKGMITTEDCGTGGTTLTWLKRQTKAKAEEKLWDVMKDNIQNTHNMVKRVSALRPELRMVRLTSDMLSAYTHPDWSWFYKQPDVVLAMERWMAPIGETARKNDVRLSFHPGQFCCIVSENEGIVQNSIAELEYHVDMMRFMGYGHTLLDAKINIHLSGKRGVDGFASAWTRMSVELRNMLTLENDEYQSGLDVVLLLKNKVGIVLDLHHHWINTGEYITAYDPRIHQVIESWCRDGNVRRPVFHYSQSHESVLTDHSTDLCPARDSLIAAGAKKAHLRAHSKLLWNKATNLWARQHWDWGDCMVEAKYKNIASTELFTQWTT
jgi:UV DNA damage repair endonuclease